MQSDENEDEWKPELHRKINEYLDREFELKLIKSSDSETNLHKLTEKIRGLKYQDKVTHFMDEKSNIYLMSKRKYARYLYELINSCKSDDEADVEDSEIFKESSPQICMNFDVEARRSSSSSSSKYSTDSIDFNNNNNNNNFSKMSEKRQKNLIDELIEMNKDKANPLFYLNQLIIDHFYEESTAAKRNREQKDESNHHKERRKEPESEIEKSSRESIDSNDLRHILLSKKAKY
jgi:hypothetical protein